MLKRDVLLPHLVLSFLQPVWGVWGAAGKAAAHPSDLTQPEAQGVVKMVSDLLMVPGHLLGWVS